MSEMGIRLRYRFSLVLVIENGSFNAMPLLNNKDTLKNVLPVLRSVAPDHVCVDGVLCS